MQKEVTGDYKDTKRHETFTKRFETETRSCVGWLYERELL